MMFLNSLTDWLRKQNPSDKTPQRPSARLRLEELEDRLVPAATGPASTYTNATVQITPGFTVTEKVTATVTTIPSFSQFPGATAPNPAPVPDWAGSTAKGGTVLFNLNNQQASATLDNNGQASATFQVPLLAFLKGSQALEISYQGTFNPTVSTPNTYEGSYFIAPIYTNFDNLLLPSTISFGMLTSLQQQGTLTFPYAAPNDFFSVPSNLPSFNTAQGETDNLGNGLIIFNYVDPGTINTVTALGFQLPGIFAFQLGAYSGFSPSSTSKS